MITKAKQKLSKAVLALARRGILLRQNDRQLAALEGKFTSRKAVIIGTGPSLKIEDLNRLSGWTTFACNKIYLAFESTTWRPDFYSICDDKIAEHAQDFAFDQAFTKTFIINSQITKPILKSNLDICYYRYNREYSISNWTINESPVAPKSFAYGIVPGGYSVMIDQLQMAYLMGFTEVAIIGADLSYFGGTKTGDRCRSGELIRYDGNESEKNYFHKNYYQPGDTTTVPNVDKMKIAWEYCRLLFESTGRTLVNASRRSELEHVTRVDFDELFPH